MRSSSPCIRANPLPSAEREEVHRPARCAVAAARNPWLRCDITAPPGLPGNSLAQRARSKRTGPSPAKKKAPDSRVRLHFKPISGSFTACCSLPAAAHHISRQQPDIQPARASDGITFARMPACNIVGEMVSRIIAFHTDRIGNASRGVLAAIRRSRARASICPYLRLRRRNASKYARVTESNCCRRFISGDLRDRRGEMRDRIVLQRNRGVPGSSRGNHVHVHHDFLARLQAHVLHLAVLLAPPCRLRSARTPLQSCPSAFRSQTESPLLRRFLRRLRPEEITSRFSRTPDRFSAITPKFAVVIPLSSIAPRPYR